jgi:hypothetical protein
MSYAITVCLQPSLSERLTNTGEAVYQVPVYLINVAVLSGPLQLFSMLILFEICFQ